MLWRDWIRTVEVEPSLYGADFSRLGEQIDTLLDVDCRVFHFDVGDGHFVEPITIGPIVLQWISPRVHARGGALDVHLMVERPAKYFEAVVASNPETEPEQVAEVAGGADIVLCMSIHPGYSGQPFREETFGRVERLRAGLPADVAIQVDGGVGTANITELRDRGASLFVAASSIFGRA